MAKPTKKKKKTLTVREQMFIREYLVDLDVRAAALRAGYTATTANDRAYTILRRPHIEAQMKIEMEKRGKRTKVTADRVIIEIERLAMFDPKDLTEVKSPQDIASLPEDVRRAIVGWKWDREGRFTVQLAKETALQMLGRHHALFVDRVEHSVTDDLAERLGEARRRANVSRA